MDRNVTEWKHIVRLGAEESHYQGYLISGAHIIQLVTDTVACLSTVRDNSVGLLANVNANFTSEVYVQDELVVTLRLERIGNTSRTYSFTVEKTIEFLSAEAHRAVPLEEPRLCAYGTCVIVVPNEE